MLFLLTKNILAGHSNIWRYHLNVRVNVNIRVVSLLTATIFLGTNNCIAESAEPPNSVDIIYSPNLLRLKQGLREINYLLNNWDEKTTYCNFGEFQRDLLKGENKEKLFKAAAETGLLDYDKSKTMNVKCKRDPEVVRAFLGLTTENIVLNKADQLLKKSSTLDLVSPDDIDDYIRAVDAYVEAVATADTLAYQARTDYASTEVFFKQDMDKNESKYLTQSKASVEKARDALLLIVKILKL